MLWYFESYEGLWESTVCLKPLMGQAHSVNLPSWCEIFPLLPTAGAMGDHRGDASLPPSTVWTASEERSKTSTVGGIKTNDRNLQHANMQPLGCQQCIPVLQWKKVGTMIKLCPDLRMQPCPQLGGWLAWRAEYLYMMGVQKKKSSLSSSITRKLLPAVVPSSSWSSKRSGSACRLRMLNIKPQCPSVY